MFSSLLSLTLEAVCAETTHRSKAAFRLKELHIRTCSVGTVAGMWILTSKLEEEMRNLNHYIYAVYFNITIQSVKVADHFEGC